MRCQRIQRITLKSRDFDAFGFTVELPAKVGCFGFCDEVREADERTIIRSYDPDGL